MGDGLLLVKHPDGIHHLAWMGQIEDVQVHVLRDIPLKSRSVFTCQ